MVKLGIGKGDGRTAEELSLTTGGLKRQDLAGHCREPLSVCGGALGEAVGRVGAGSWERWEHELPAQKS